MVNELDSVNKHAQSSHTYKNSLFKVETKLVLFLNVLQAVRLLKLSGCVLTRLYEGRLTLSAENSFVCLYGKFGTI